MSLLSLEMHRFRVTTVSLSPGTLGPNPSHLTRVQLAGLALALAHFPWFFPHLWLIIHTTAPPPKYLHTPLHPPHTDPSVSTPPMISSPSFLPCERRITKARSNSPTALEALSLGYFQPHLRHYQEIVLS